MTHDENEKNPHHLESLENQEIDGKNVMGGGTGDIDHSDVPVASLENGTTEIGYNTDVIPLDDPMYGGGRILTGDDAPPINQGPNFNNTPGYHGGNT